jgi:hypothetical protein
MTEEAVLAENFATWVRDLGLRVARTGSADASQPCP